MRSAASMSSRLMFLIEPNSSLAATSLTGMNWIPSFLPLGEYTNTRAEGDQHRFLQTDRDAYRGVKAYYYVEGSERMEAIVGDEERQDSATYLRPPIECIAGGKGRMGKSSERECSVELCAGQGEARVEFGMAIPRDRG